MRRLIWKFCDRIFNISALKPVEHFDYALYIQIENKTKEPPKRKDENNAKTFHSEQASGGRKWKGKKRNGELSRLLLLAHIIYGP